MRQIQFKSLNVLLTGNGVILCGTDGLSVAATNLFRLEDVTVRVFGTHVVFDGYENIKEIHNIGRTNITPEMVMPEFVETVSEKKFGIFSTGEKTQRVLPGLVVLKPEFQKRVYRRYTTNNYFLVETPDLSNGKLTGDTEFPQ